MMLAEFISLPGEAHDKNKDEEDIINNQPFGWSHCKAVKQIVIKNLLADCWCQSLVEFEIWEYKNKKK